MTHDEMSLARFQAALLEQLATERSPAEILKQLRSLPELAPFREYIDSFESRPLEVAACLVKKWGRRATNSEIADGAG